MGTVFSSFKSCFELASDYFAKRQVKAVKKVIKNEMKNEFRKLSLRRYRSKSI